MPYITQQRRALFDDKIASLATATSADTTGGEINYIVSRLIMDWLRKRRLSYAAIADAVGVLETAKLEFYRRVAVPYEDRKIEQNGDVWGDLISRGEDENLGS